MASSLEALRGFIQTRYQKLIGLSRRYSWLRYVLVGAVTIVFTFFVGERTVFSYMRHMERKAFLEKEYNYYRPRYEVDSARLSEIRNNPEHIERIAREKYYMHAPGEELFVLAPPEQAKDK